MFDRRWLILIFSGVFTLAAPVPARAWREMDAAVTELAARGLGSACDEALDVEAALGRDADEIASVREKAEAKLRRVGDRVSPAPKAAAALRKAAKELESVLPEWPEADRPRLAELILRLDGSLESCHALLGHVKKDDGWVTPEAAATAGRRAEIAEVLRRVRRLEVPIETGPADDPILAALFGEPGHRVRSGTISISSVLISPERAARILRETVRAYSLAVWLHTGNLALAYPRETFDVIAIGSREGYLRGLGISGLDAATAEYARDMGGAYLPSTAGRLRFLHVALPESQLVIGLLHGTHHYFGIATYGKALQPCLQLGIESWVCLSYIGAPLPPIDRSGADDAPASSRRSVTARELEEAKEMYRLAEAGLAGSRSFLVWLARRHEDPPWTEAMRPEMSLISGIPLLKTTLVAEYLFECGRFGEICRATAGPDATPAATAGRMEAALGEKLPEFERRWRDWLLPLDPGLAARVEGPPASAGTPEEARLLAHLGRIRDAAGMWSSFPVRMDEDSSAGCRAHALYLDRHRDQLAAWPDAHEEYPDREGFSPEGARAGLASVIAPGTSTPEEALDAWMGTYFHRLPLLDPGLLRVGWAQVKGTAVLDAGSFVAPAERVLAICWPPADARDVPLSFRPEIPNPFPGQDQSGWGYPITIQLFQFDSTPALRISLHEGTKVSGTPVPALESTPNRPGNVELAPRNAYCLIPTSPLAPGAAYTVRATGFEDGSDLVWTFRTGSR